MEEAKIRAETYDTDESSINTEEEAEIAEVGISVKDAQKAFVGLTADKSSDEELIPAGFNLERIAAAALETGPESGMHALCVNRRRSCMMRIAKW